MYTGTKYNLITVEDFRILAPEVDLAPYADPTISGMISQASQRVADYLEYNPIIETITGEVKRALINTNGDLNVFPAKLPVVSLQSLAITKGSVSIDINLTTTGGATRYNIDYNRRSIVYPYGELTLLGVPIFANFYALRGTTVYTKITYTAGYQPDELPDTIKLATVLMMRDILSKKFNTTGASKISQGGISLEYSQGSDKRAGKSELILEAERLLGPYRRIG